MKLEQLQKQVGNALRLWPSPMRVESDGTQAESDAPWVLEAVISKGSKGVSLRDSLSSHTVEVRLDNIQEYRSPGYLMLRCRIVVRPEVIEVIPFLTVTPVEKASEPFSLTGLPLQLLRLSVERETSQVFGFLEADDAIQTLSVDPSEYRDAARELDAIGLVSVQANLNHPSGIARTILNPERFIGYAPRIMEDFQSTLELILGSLRGAASPDWVPVRNITEDSGVSPALVDLILQGLVQRGYLISHGTGSRDFGHFFVVEVTGRGRRLLRGDDTIYPRL